MVAVITTDTIQHSDDIGYSRVGCLRRYYLTEHLTLLLFTDTIHHEAEEPQLKLLNLSWC